MISNCTFFTYLLFYVRGPPHIRDQRYNSKKVRMTELQSE